MEAGSALSHGVKAFPQWAAENILLFVLVSVSLKISTEVIITQRCRLFLLHKLGNTNLCQTNIKFDSSLWVSFYYEDIFVYHGYGLSNAIFPWPSASYSKSTAITISKLLLLQNAKFHIWEYREHLCWRNCLHTKIAFFIIILPMLFALELGTLKRLDSIKLSKKKI